jgi:hypothetical protein
VGNACVNCSKPAARFTRKRSQVRKNLVGVVNSRRMSTTVHTFPDANVVLHFPAFDGLNWCEMCQADEVVIHVTQPLLSELNKVKELGESKSIRKRAATAQRRLTRLLDTHGLTAQVAANVKLVLEDKSPDLRQYPELNPSVADDILVAAVLDFCGRTKENAALITDDNGLALMVKAAKWKLKVLRPPQSARLPDEADEEKKETDRLRQRLAELEGAMPSLELLFSNSKNNFVVDDLAVDIEAAIAAAVAKEKDDQRPLPIPERLVRLERMTVGAAAALGKDISELLRNDPDAVASYNTQLEQYFVEFETACRANFEIKARTAQLYLQLENAGSAPATDVFATMHFPDGLQVLKKKKWKELLLDMPEPPDPPGTFKGYRRFLDPLSYLHDIRPISIHDPTLSIRQTNSFEVEWHVPKLQQDRVSKVDTIFVLFDSKPFSFQIDYKIVADNLPRKATGNLHVVVP